MTPQLETVYHVTVLSNFARAYDKYSRCYKKEWIPESTFPDQFFVLHRSELAIGIDKAGMLLTKLGLPGNRLLVLAASLPAQQLQPNLRTGKGRFLASSSLPVAELYFVDESGALEASSAEEAYAASLAVIAPDLLPYAELRPRTLSVLPIARACQAACKFCFSESSASVEQMPHRLHLPDIEALCLRARQAGAERFVITGGGEPGLIKHVDMLALIRLGRRYFEKVVVISNGYHLSRLAPAECAQRLRDYVDAGLTVLSISRHFHDPVINRNIMCLDTNTEAIFSSFRELGAALGGLNLRLICVLQKGGVQDDASLQRYVDWASQQGVQELCFKELYVSTTRESVYHAYPENQWSLHHQVPLSLVTQFFAERNFAIVNRLPWGAPVFSGDWHGKRLTVAAYTEPSLFWERSQGVARSWNIMADGQCLVSLEDPASALMAGGRQRIVHMIEMA